MGLKKRGFQENYSKTTNLTQVGPAQPKATVIRVKTSGRIGSATPHSELKGGFTVDNNRKTGPNAALGALAESHMSTLPKGDTWSPRVKLARKMAQPNMKTYANPVNQKTKALKPVKPD